MSVHFDEKNVRIACEFIIIIIIIAIIIKSKIRLFCRKSFYKPDEMDSDDVDSELEMQNETNEDILFGFAGDEDDEFSIVQRTQTDPVSDIGDSDYSVDPHDMEDLQSDIDNDNTDRYVFNQ